jgi:hypothetical protein
MGKDACKNGDGEGNEEAEEGWKWSMYFIYLYENKTMKCI